MKYEWVAVCIGLAAAAVVVVAASLFVAICASAKRGRHEPPVKLHPSHLRRALLRGHLRDSGDGVPRICHLASDSDFCPEGHVQVLWENGESALAALGEFGGVLYTGPPAAPDVSARALLRAVEDMSPTSVVLYMSEDLVASKRAPGLWDRVRFDMSASGCSLAAALDGVGI